MHGMPSRGTGDKPWCSDREDCEQFIARVVDTAVDKAIRTTLLTLGIDATEPVETQRDMQYLRAWRENSQAMRRKVATVVVTALVTASLTLGLIGLRHWGGLGVSPAPAAGPAASAAYLPHP